MVHVLYTHSCSWRLHAGMIYDHIKQPHFPCVLKIGWVSLRSLCPLFYARHKIWTTSSSVISLWGLFAFASFDWHFFDVATTGACTCPHHSNNPIESAEKKGPRALCSLAKCQESSSGFTWREMERQSSTFIPDSLKMPYIIHVLIGGFNRLLAHLCLTNWIVQHVQSHRDCFEEFPWPQLWSASACVFVCICSNCA